MFLFKPKKTEEEKKPEVSQANIDLEIITNMNQLWDTLQKTFIKKICL